MRIYLVIENSGTDADTRNIVASYVSKTSADADASTRSTEAGIQESYVEEVALVDMSEFIIRLTPRQREIIELTCGIDGADPIPVRTIATKYNVTLERAYAILGKAIERLVQRV